MRKTVNFVKYYREHYDLEMKLQKGASNLLKEVIFSMETDNTLMINIFTKKKFANKIGTTVGTISDGLSKLKKSDLVVSIATGYFMINPYYCSYCLLDDTEKLRDRYTKLKIYPDLPRGMKANVKEKDVPY